MYYTFKFVLFLYAVILRVKKIILCISLFVSLGLVILIAVLMLMLIQKLFWRLDELFSLCIYALNLCFFLCFELAGSVHCILVCVHVDMHSIIHGRKCCITLTTTVPLS